MKIAISGGAGDIVYSIPVARALGVTCYAIKENFYLPPHGNLYLTMANFMRSQGFDVECTSGAYYLSEFDPELKYDYNFDLFREMTNRGKVHIIKNMALRFNVKLHEWNAPFINNITPATDGPENLIHLTPRWREGSKVNWKLVLQNMSGSVGFIGFQHEWIEFCQRYGSVEWINTRDILQLAEYIAGSKRLYCNQSVALTIAQGLGKEYWLDKKLNKTNTLFFTKNENLL